MNKQTIPPGLFEIPDDTPAEQMVHLAAAYALQAIMLSIGSRDVEPGHHAVDTDQMMKSLAMAAAMMISGDDRFRTPRDLRKEAEKWGKLAAGYASILRDGEDLTGTSIFDALGLKQVDRDPT